MRMLEKDALFYMANAHPELGRLFDAHTTGNKMREAEVQKRALSIINTILAFNTLSFAAREEWYTLRNLIEGYAALDARERAIIKNYAEPFALKYMQRYIAR